MEGPKQKIFVTFLVFSFLLVPSSPQGFNLHTAWPKTVVAGGNFNGDGRGCISRLQQKLVDLSEIIPDYLWLTDVTIRIAEKKKKGLREVVEETHLIIKGVTVPIPGREAFEGIVILITALNSLESFQRDFERPVLPYTRLMREKSREILEFEISSKLRPKARIGEGTVEVFKGKVVDVPCGDIISVISGNRIVKVRLYGVDCPEWGQPYCIRAKKCTKDLAFGEWVDVRVRDIGWWGRKIGEVILPNGRSLSYELVGAGMAWWYRMDAPSDPILKALEAVARLARRGLWEEWCPMPPWEWRRPQVVTLKIMGQGQR